MTHRGSVTTNAGWEVLLALTKMGGVTIPTSTLLNAEAWLWRHRDLTRADSGVSRESSTRVG